MAFQMVASNVQLNSKRQSGVLITAVGTVDCENFMPVGIENIIQPLRQKAY